VLFVYLLPPIHLPLAVVGRDSWLRLIPNKSHVHVEAAAAAVVVVAAVVAAVAAAAAVVMVMAMAMAVAMMGVKMGAMMQHQLLQMLLSPYATIFHLAVFASFLLLDLCAFEWRVRLVSRFIVLAFPINLKHHLVHETIFSLLVGV